MAKHHGRGFQPAGRHVVGEARQAGERLLEPHLRRDEGARSPALHQDALLHQTGDRLADGDPRNAELLGEIALAGQRRIGLERALADGILDGLLELEIKRRGIAVVEGKEGQRLARCSVMAASPEARGGREGWRRRPRPRGER